MFFYDFISLSNRFQYLKEILYIHISAHLYFCISIYLRIYIAEFKLQMQRNSY